MGSVGRVAGCVTGPFRFYQVKAPVRMTHCDGPVPHDQNFRHGRGGDHAYQCGVEVLCSRGKGTCDNLLAHFLAKRIVQPCFRNAGVQASGFPNLLDDEWMWGGTMEDIHQTVRYGIRNEDHLDTRWSEMPAFGRDGLLDDQEIDQVVHYVLRLSGQNADAAMAAAGEEVYMFNCASCHGDSGEGDTFVGAPPLNSAIWLYGGTFEDIRHTVVHSRFGIMPGFAGRLRDAEIRAVAAYVHQLGGGQ